MVLIIDFLLDTIHHESCVLWSPLQVKWGIDSVIGPSWSSGPG